MTSTKVINYFSNSVTEEITKAVVSYRYGFSDSKASCESLSDI